MALIPLPVRLFAALAVFSLQKAIRPGARRTWAWGRVGGGPPLSRGSYAVWGVTFSCIAFTIARAPRPPAWAALGLGLCLLAIVVAGIADTRADGTRVTRPSRARPDPGGDREKQP